jgi:YedE family putative selenium metabolism protein
MLRTGGSSGRVAAGVALTALAGVGAAALVALGNPGNMGVCGACFLRDLAGALGFHTGKGPEIFRPEVAGVVLGAFAVALATRRYGARSGSYGAARFFLGLWMSIAALVFLGCPFRLLQRLGGGDLNAWIGLPGFLGGVGLGLAFEKRGYSIGKTAPAPAPVGLLAPLALAAVLALFLAGALRGPGPGSSAPPAHAPFGASLAIALAVGAALSASGFCAITAAREAFLRRKAMLVAALALVLAYGLTSFVTGKFRMSLDGQPIAHGDVLWNLLSLGLLGLTGALAGGCPVRQLVMAGEGNGDAWLVVCGLVVGGALAQNLGLVSAAPGGPTGAGKVAVAVGWAFALLYGLAVVRAHRRTAPPLEARA